MSAEQAADAASSAASAPAAPVKETPLAQLGARLSPITEKAAHSEMWGVELSNLDHVPTKVVLQKFLRANNNDVNAAEKQLTSALEWRKKMQPRKLVDQTFDKKKYGDLGFVTVHQDQDGKDTVVTWNIYGAVKDKKATFGNVDEFIKWRAAIMELSVQKLKLDQITEPIPEGGDDPYQMIQVHDYLNVSFFRMDSSVKAASKETIAVFSMAYPELLAHKYFVNVPAIMGWMFGAMKLFLAPATLRKFHPMTSGTTLATELKNVSSSLPKEYGGQGPAVTQGITVKLADSKTEIPPEAPEAPVAAVNETELDSETTATKPANEGAKVIESKPIEESKLAVATKQVDDLKLTEEPKQAVDSSSAEAPKPSEGSRDPPAVVQPLELTEQAKTAEEVKPAVDEAKVEVSATESKEVEETNPAEDAKPSVTAEAEQKETAA